MDLMHAMNITMQHHFKKQAQKHGHADLQIKN